MMQKALLFILFLFFFSTLVAQHHSISVKSKGIPYIHNYPAKEYGGDVFNHAIVQDNRGIIYVGNNSGVLEYDGSSWRLIKLSNNSRVYSLAFDKIKNRVYVGGVGDFGYLAPNHLGKTIFVSLLPKLSKKQRNFKRIWGTTTISSNKIIFRAQTAIFILNKGKIQIIKPDKKYFFHRLFYINKTIYVREKAKGLLQLVNNKLQLVPNGDLFASVPLYAMQPFDNTHILIVTRKRGFFLYNGKTFTPWQTEISNKLKNYRVYDCKLLGTNYFIINTLRKGIIILDKKGKVVQHLDKSKGLINSSVYNSFVDKDDNIWIASNQGLSHITTNSGFSLYNHHLGLTSSLASSAISLSEQLYLGTMQAGLFTKPVISESNLIGLKQSFSKITHLNNILHIYQTPTTLLIGHTGGIWFHNINKNEGKEIARGYTTIKILPLFSKKNTVLASTLRGLVKLSKKNKKWKVIHIKNSAKSHPYMAEYKPGKLLISDDNGVLSKSILNEALDSVVIHTEYDTLQGLPQRNGNRVFQIKDEVIVATYKGIYRYNETKDRFERHPHFLNLNQMFVRYVKSDKKGNLWLWAGDPNNLELMFLKKDSISNTYQIVKTPFQKLRNTFMEFGTHINPIDEKNVLFGAPEGAVHYDPSIKIDYQRPYQCLIRKVETMEDKDSLIFGGGFINKVGHITAEQPKKALKKLSYRHNNLRFSFAATWYEDQEKIEYSHYLEGFDPHWSGWIGSPQKEYTNIPYGKYTFKVKARNIYGTVSTVASYSFKIRPPWYQTTSAYIGYAVLAVLLVWGIVKLNIRRLQMKNKKLEKVVQKRTAEIVEKNQVLHIQKEEITAQAENLKSQKEELEILNENISEKNIIIEKKNKDIVASINYARRIQSAMLPPMPEITQALPDLFILYRPRDIVSGDFYWFAEVENASGEKESIIIAADCTGHGVPGAFVSMVGNELLNEIVKMREIHQPKLILDWLHDGIKRVFHQKETQSRDGMDITICAINKEKKLMQFAGAQNPLLYIKDGEKHIIKGDKMSIGGENSKMTNGYTNHEILLDGPITFYLFSDGFQDQFGGPKGKKFMTGKFHKLLLEISDKPIKEQGEILGSTLDNWMEHTEQIDDILVLGVKV